MQESVSMHKSPTPGQAFAHESSKVGGRGKERKNGMKGSPTKQKTYLINYAHAHILVELEGPPVLPLIGGVEHGVAGPVTPVVVYGNHQRPVVCYHVEVRALERLKHTQQQPIGIDNILAS